MTTSIIIQIISLVMLMLLAVPGTQWIWKFGNPEIGEFSDKVIGKLGDWEKLESQKKLEVQEIRKPGLFTELSKIAATIF